MSHQYTYPKGVSMSEEVQSVYDRAAEEDLRAVHGPKLKAWDWLPGLFFKPKKLLIAVRLRGPKAGDFLIPLCLVIFGTLMFALLAYNSGLSERIYKQRHGIEQSAPIPAQQQADAENFMSGLPSLHDTLNPIGWVMAFTMGFITMLLFGSVVLLLIRLVGKQRLNFMGALSLTGIGAYILFGQIVVSAVLVVITGSWVTANPLTWFGLPETGGWAFLAYLNPFNLYALALIGYGAHIVGRVSTQRAIAIVVILWILPVLATGLGLLIA